MDTSYISSHEFFASLGENVMSKLLDNVGEKSFNRGERLFSQGDSADQFLLIRSGDVTTGNLVSGQMTNERVLQPGDVVGWSWVVPPYSWCTTAIAQSDTQAYVFDGVELLVECEKDPRIGYALFKIFAGMMGQRLAATHDTGVGRERTLMVTSTRINDAIARMQDDPRDRERFLAI